MKGNCRVRRLLNYIGKTESQITHLLYVLYSNPKIHFFFNLTDKRQSDFLTSLY